MVPANGVKYYTKNSKKRNIFFISFKVLSIDYKAFLTSGFFFSEGVYLRFFTFRTSKSKPLLLLSWYKSTVRPIKFRQTPRCRRYEHGHDPRALFLQYDNVRVHFNYLKIATMNLPRSNILRVQKSHSEHANTNAATWSSGE